MVENLKKRGCVLETVLKYPSLESQIQRYNDCHWSIANAKDMLSVYNNVLDASERKRIERLEFFDEIEEWRLIQAHYMVCLARNNEKTLNRLKL
mmetsp:Transcript_19858/g.34076  ORF Transcript_19858/g.34076 Transcript_19858/m.34076 type:complete len:94 (+) Transcript_19858:178-459(+)